MNFLNEKTNTLIKELSYIDREKKRLVEEEVVKTSRAVSTLAVVYESVRNSVEFSAEHLIRQAAISRILKRRLFLNQPSKKLSLRLIRELLWARYLKEGSVSTKKVKEIEEIIEKYRFAIKDDEPKVKSKKNNYSDWLIEVAACEVEETLVHDPTQQVLINYVYESLREKINFDAVSEEEKSIQIYIAVERGFAKNSDSLISYRLLKASFPDWVRGDMVLNDALDTKLKEAYIEISSQQNHPLAGSLKNTVVKLSPPFNLVRELIEEYEDEFKEIVKDKESFGEVAEITLEKLYDETQEKLNRASVRSIIYIFLTKMVFGILIELPFDLIRGGVNLTALGINVLFPPGLLYLLNLGTKIPDKENTQKLLDTTEGYLFDSEKSEIAIVGKPKKTRALQKFFFAGYVLAYILIFGGIIWFLNLLDFNLVSQIIFLFFLSVVSFFAYRVRGIAKDFHLEEEGKETFFTSLIDFLFLPIIRVGQWISVQVSYLNILSMILDFIIEAPLKSFLGVVEEWVHFVRTKREEITT